MREISEHAFSNCKYLKQVEIPFNSNLRNIGSSAFYKSPIESLTIASTLKELKDNWCNFTPELNQIRVNPENAYFTTYFDTFLIKKSRIEGYDYDRLEFCVRKAETVRIPNFIKHICSHAFHLCKKLRKVEIGHDSRLKSFGEESFRESSIEKITIPSQVTEICEAAFFYCRNLRRVEIENDSKLEKIGDEAFSGSSIENIIIPSQVRKIGEKAFFNCFRLHLVEIEEKSKLLKIELITFFSSENVIIMIPADLRNRLIS